MLKLSFLKNMLIRNKKVFKKLKFTKFKRKKTINRKIVFLKLNPHQKFTFSKTRSKKKYRFLLFKAVYDKFWRFKKKFKKYLRRCRIERLYKRTLSKKVILNYWIPRKSSSSALRRRFFQTCFYKIKRRNQDSIWHQKRYWIIKRGIKSLNAHTKRLSFNPNVESNRKIIAYTIISKEFFSAPKFSKIKPHAFTYKINKFIKHFF